MLVQKSPFNSLEFIQSMIPKRREALEAAQETYEQVFLNVQAEDERMNAAIEAAEQAQGWADRFDTSNLDTKRIILAQIINKVTVGRDYNIHIDFKITFKQFTGKMAV